jgi:hypothetical protein
MKVVRGVLFTLFTNRQPHWGLLSRVLDLNFTWLLSHLCGAHAKKTQTAETAISRQAMHGCGGAAARLEA